ncbi:MAG TPA: DUF3253 domain-containing protein [Magnetovibrio sp.]
MNDETTKQPAKDDPIAGIILDALADGGSLTFNDIAMRIFEMRKKAKDRPDGWRRYITSVKQQAVHLARQGRVEIVRKGEVADPNDFKGIVRIRLAAD